MTNCGIRTNIFIWKTCFFDGFGDNRIFYRFHPSRFQIVYTLRGFSMMGKVWRRLLSVMRFHVLYLMFLLRWEGTGRNRWC